MNRVRVIAVSILVIAFGASGHAAQASDWPDYDRLCGAQLYVSEDPAGYPLPGGPTPPADVDLPDRIAGADRFATAAEIAAQWDEYFDVDIAFVTTGLNFPDALAAGPAAAHLGGPVLLTRPDELPTVTRERLVALDPPRIVVLGDERSVSAEVAAELSEIAPVERWSGPDRYATMRAILSHAWGVDGDGDGEEGENLPTVIVATGRGYADALSAAAAAGATGGAVVLVDGAQASIPGTTLDLMRDLDPARIYVAGGVATVSCEIARQLDAEFPATGVKRIFGFPDRFATSANIGDYFAFSSGSTYAFLTNGLNYPDALAAAPLAGRLRGLILTTPPWCIPLHTDGVLGYFENPEDQVVVLGGYPSVSQAVVDRHSC